MSMLDLYHRGATGASISGPESAESIMEATDHTCADCGAPATTHLYGDDVCEPCGAKRDHGRQPPLRYRGGGRWSTDAANAYDMSVGIMPTSR